jgi:anti-sigma regulatory factor (Ser/Thr protein kinase)
MRSSSDPRRVVLELDSSSAAPRAARAAVRRMLQDADPRVVERATLAVSELVTNAVIHTESRITLDITVDERHVRVMVEDGDMRMPVALDDAGAHGGFGLHIVGRLADSWGVAPRDNGKAVWVDLMLDHHTTPADDERGVGHGDLQDAFG